MKKNQEIAIIGFHGLFPGTEYDDTLWNILEKGEVSISEIPKERWNSKQHPVKMDNMKNDGNNVLWGGFIEGIDKFDYEFFGIPYEDAQNIDPNQRLFLESVWSCLEYAGYGDLRNRCDNRVGVFVGNMMNDFSLLHHESGFLNNITTGYEALTFDIANRVSFLLNLNGPSMVIQAACSSSLMAVHLACQSLNSDECNMAVAGGVNLILHPSHYISQAKERLLSFDRKKYLFKKDSEGYVPGEGVGSILLKPLWQAERDKDYIHGVVLLSEVNNNGSGMYYRAPNSHGQSKLLTQAYKKHNINPETITHIEMSAYGSEMTDLTEFQALLKSFGKLTNKKGFCTLGSLKPNIGHLEAASGISQIIKVLYQLKNGKIAPLLYDKNIEKEYDLKNTPFRCPDKLTDWQNKKINESNKNYKGNRRAGINSFGAGGVNSHIVIEEYKYKSEIEKPDKRTKSNLPFMLSAPSDTMLKQYVKILLSDLKSREKELSYKVENIIYTLAVGREKMPMRLAIIVSTTADLIIRLEDYLKGNRHPDVFYKFTEKNIGDPIAVKNVGEYEIKDLAEKWTKGLEFDCIEFYGQKNIQKIPLPTYPFSKPECRLSDKTGSEKKIKQTQNKMSDEKVKADKFHLKNYIKKIISDLAEIPYSKIGTQQPFSTLGLNSLIITEINKQFEKKFGTHLPKTLLFECQNIDQLADYLETKYIDKQINYNFENDETNQIAEHGKEINRLNVDKEIRPFYELNIKNGGDELCDIAIVGISGRYPLADNIDEFWDNLVQAKDCISKIPNDRWDNRKFFSENRKNKGKIYTDWGGFISDIDKFDPLFFEISPKEAEKMDPQERLFLETAWKAIEDAGLTPDELEEKNSKNKVGVFVGVMWGHYQLYGMPNSIKGKQIPNSDFWAIPNRVSYSFNFTGPSIAIDSACSSSMVAIKLACDSIINKECTAAIAGGVSLTCHPQKYIYECQRQFISLTGRCRSFGDGADGFVTGEGVGAILLKPLSSAIEDCNSIYAVIKGAHINHDGKTNGFTVPDPNSQKELIERALRKAKIDPATISLIETHGTGTELGDPIEIEGLKKAFGPYFKKMEKCSIGSVKSNIGHLESAAGIAGLTKVILQMQNKKFVPSIHSGKLNPNINIDDTPFKVQQKVERWKRKIDLNGKRTDRNECGFKIPRRACISAFGAGGTNAHIVMEEYESQARTEKEKGQKQRVIVLSARNHSRLMEYAKKLIKFIEKNRILDKSANENKKLSLANIAYTLQKGRVHLKERMAFVCLSIEQMHQKLIEFCENDIEEKGIYRGSLKKHEGLTELIGNGEEGEIFIQNIIAKKKYDKIARLWVAGVKINWDLLYDNNNLFRVHLPTYPFAKESYWIDDQMGYDYETFSSVAENQKKNRFSKNARITHPMLDVNVSTFKECKFETHMTGKEFYLNEHRVNGKKVLPGSAIIEMARAAAEIAGQRKVRKIMNIIWSRAIACNPDTISVQTKLLINNGKIHFKVESKNENKDSQVNAQGLVIYSDDDHEKSKGLLKKIQFDDDQTRCADAISGNDCYELFKISGLDYGPSFRCIENIRIMGRKAVVEMKLHGSVGNNAGDYFINPDLLDGAFQSTMILINGRKKDKYNNSTLVPFSIQEIEILGRMTEQSFAFIELKENTLHDKNSHCFDIIITDNDKNRVVRITDLILKDTKKKLQKCTDETPLDKPIFFKPIYDKCSKLHDEKAPQNIEDIVIIDSGKNLYNELINNNDIIKNKICLITPGEKFERITNYNFEMNLCNEDDFERLFKTINHIGISCRNIVYIHRDNHEIDETENIINNAEKTFEALYYLTRELIKRKIEKEVLISSIVLCTNPEISPISSAIYGFAKTVNQENNKINFKIISYMDDLKRPYPKKWFDISHIVVNEIENRSEQIQEIKYAGNERYIKKYVEIGKDEKKAIEYDKRSIKKNGIYLITGGMGGLGLIFAEYLAKNYQAKLILVGRSAPNKKHSERIRKLKQLGADAVYIQCDISSIESMKKLSRYIKKKYKPLNGIIHSAGIVRDAYITQKKKDDVEQVLAPKIRGSVILDKIFKKNTLDIFLTFSSTASIIGNIGQCDYAFGNGFMDGFVEKRNHHMKNANKIGSGLSINWPLWREGGMQVHPSSEKFLKNAYGMTAMDTEHGIHSLIFGLSSATHQFIVLNGNENKIRKVIGNKKSTDEHTENSKLNTESYCDDNLKDHLIEKLIAITGNILNIPTSKIDSDESMDSYGFDSISMTEFANQINEEFDIDITPALFFELNYSSIEEIAKELIKKYHKYLLKNGQINAIVSRPAISKEPENEHEQIQYHLNDVCIEKNEFVDVFEKQNKFDENSNENDVAVIGISGIMPGAEDIDEYWNNLIEGKDMVREIPSDRSEWDLLSKKNDILRYGGFIDNISHFDTMFFNISPKEAELIDPQQRKFLELTWKAIEDAGYKPSDLSGSNTAIYAGIATNDYLELIGQVDFDVDGYLATGNMQSVLANRISYLFNFHGPSEIVNTACSSSLVAINKAVKAIRDKTCDFAIAGGVNMIILPKWSRSFFEAGMISPTGRCKTFDESADGYVRGEGAGVLLLKNLKQAEKDSDNIYAVIKGISLNHGGRSNSLTAPNANAQSQLLIQAYNDANIDLRSVSYIETHGTGTKIGDPVEINGLKKAYAHFNNNGHNKDQNFEKIGLGAVKTNIGHLETASGMASIFKVILSLKNKKIPGNIHFNELNRHIELEGSPFYIINENQDWFGSNEMKKSSRKRRAGVSSFGFGGANAHVVLEEYISNNSNGKDEGKNSRFVFVLSAKDEKQLRIQVSDLKRYVESCEQDLDDITYTLQVGREAMEFRAACVINDKNELISVLSDYLKGKKPKSFFSGYTKSGKTDNRLLINDDEGMEYIQKLADNKKLGKLANFWVKGIDIDWTLLPRRRTPKRLSLPTYPFKKERHWIEKEKKKGINAINLKNVLHPVVHENISSLKQQQFKTLISGNEYFIEDHRIGSERVLPGAVLLEMGIASGNLSNREGQEIKVIQNVVWVKPFKYEGRVAELYTSLHPKNDSSVEFMVSGGESLEKNNIHQIHVKGMFKTFIGQNDMQRQEYDLDKIKRGMSNIMNRDQCYDLFKNYHIDYGKTFKTIQEIHYNKTEALSRLKLDDSIKKESDLHFIHPCILDGAFQSTIALLKEKEMGSETTYLPFSLKKLILHDKVTKECMIYIERLKKENMHQGNAIQFDLKIISLRGKCLAEMNGFTLRYIPEKRKIAHNSVIMKHEWEKEDTEHYNDKNNGRFLIFDHHMDLIKEIIQTQKCSEHNITWVQPGGRFGIKAPRHCTMNVNSKKDFYQLARHLSENKEIPDYIIINTNNNYEQKISKSSENQNNEWISSPFENSFCMMLYLSQAFNQYIKSEGITLLFLVSKAKNQEKSENEIDKLNLFYKSVAGFNRSVSLENHKYDFRLIEFDEISSKKMPELILTEIENSDSPEIRYDQTGRYKRKIVEFNGYKNVVSTDMDEWGFKENGVYLLTGGAGGIGMLIAEYFAQEKHSQIILCGRSDIGELPDDTQKKLKGQEQIEYRRTDIRDKNETEELINNIKNEYGNINGVIHLAGVIRDSLMINKSIDEAKEVIDTKIKGVLWLDEATKNEKLDFFICFSSISSILGNIGQTDYAYANRFLDNYMEIRENYRKCGIRHGKSISINWPLWENGGMKISDEIEEILEKKYGMKPLNDIDGLLLLKKILNSQCGQAMVLYGSQAKINTNSLNEIISIKKKKNRIEQNKKQIQKKSKEQNNEILFQKTEKELMKICSELLKVSIEELDTETELDEYGLDSIMMIQVLERLESKYGIAMDPNLLVEYTTIESLSQYLINEELIETASENYDIEPKKDLKKNDACNQLQNDACIQSKTSDDNRYHRYERFVQSTTDRPAEYDIEENGIAIIGMACRFPFSYDIDTYWRNLDNGNYLVTEVPPDRWRIEEYYDASHKDHSKSHSKWGGFLKHIDLFDPGFFKITCSDAIFIDPQQRILLELCQSLIDHSGYNKLEIYGKNVSVFIGGGESSYLSSRQHMIPEEYRKHILINSIPNMLAARISNFYNLRGASQSIDTACSSALVAIHEACRALNVGDTDMAIAGGIDLLLDQKIFLKFSHAGVLSPSGISHVFDERADGIVLAEGAGLILLKPVTSAIRDNDRIYGVIKGSAVNNDGYTIGMTVPSKDGQKSVIKQALKRSGKSPEQIDYLEAHGTGTLLGDPIEIKAATEVYREYTDKLGYCGVGSVKSNLGHLLRASGMAGIIKILLALKNRRIPATLNCEKPHPRFNFERSPFWPVIEPVDWNSKNGGRCAAISSFGFGGTNCHMIIEEFNAKEQLKNCVLRKPKPKTEFKRQRCWLDGNTSIDKSCVNEFAPQKYKELLQELYEQKITPDHSIQFKDICI